MKWSYQNEIVSKTEIQTKWKLKHLLWRGQTMKCYDGIEMRRNGSWQIARKATLQDTMNTNHNNKIFVHGMRVNIWGSWEYQVAVEKVQLTKISLRQLRNETQKQRT
jgi:hypothetical protein